MPHDNLPMLLPVKDGYDVKQASNVAKVRKTLANGHEVVSHKEESLDPDGATHIAHLGVEDRLPWLRVNTALQTLRG